MRTRVRVCCASYVCMCYLVLSSGEDGCLLSLCLVSLRQCLLLNPELTVGPTDPLLFLPTYRVTDVCVATPDYLCGFGHLNSGLMLGQHKFLVTELSPQPETLFLYL